MLPRAHRLKHRSLFGRVYGKGRSRALDLVVVYALPTNAGYTRVGFSVSKKLGGAVVRNRVKRLLREAIKPLLVEVSDNFDIVIVARKKAPQAGLDDLSRAVRELLRRLGVLRTQTGN